MRLVRPSGSGVSSSVGTRLDAGSIQLVQLVHESDDPGQLAGQEFTLAGVQTQAGQLFQVSDESGIDGHAHPPDRHDAPRCPRERAWAACMTDLS